MKVDFWKACAGESVMHAEGKAVCDAEGQVFKKPDTEKVTNILTKVKPAQLLELVLWQDPESRQKCKPTALDQCLMHKDEKCSITIIEHILKYQQDPELLSIDPELLSIDPELLSIVFPYAGGITSTNMVEQIIDLYKEYPGRLLKSVTCKNKMTALHMACKSGNSNVVSILLELPNKCDQKMKKSVLMMQDGTGKSALHWACHHGNNDVVLPLLDSLQNFGKDVMKNVLLLEDSETRTALHLACREGHDKIVSDLLTLLKYCGEEIMEEALRAQDTKQSYKKSSDSVNIDNRTPLHWACEGGHTKVVSTLLDSLKTCRDDVMKNVLLMGDKDNRTVLHLACMRGHLDIVRAIVALLKECGAGIMKETLLKQDTSSEKTHDNEHRGNRTVLHWACEGGHTKVVSVLLDSLKTCGKSEVEDAFLMKDAYEEIALQLACNGRHSKIVFLMLECTLQTKQEIITKFFSHSKKETRRLFEGYDKRLYKEVLEHILAYVNAIKNTDKVEREKVLMQFCKVYLLFASEKDFRGHSSFREEELIPLHTEIFDKCMEHLTDRLKKEEGHMKGEATVSSSFPAFSFLSDKDVSYDRAKSCHPLVSIGKSGHLGLMKHPYIATCVDMHWTSLARYAFYTNVFLYLLFLIFFSAFVTAHEVDTSEIGFKTQYSTFADACAYITIVLALCLLAFEFLQAKTMGKKYGKLTENSLDLAIFIGSVVLLLISIIREYNSWIHCFGCNLIVIAAIRGALILTHMPMVGHKFQMLMSVSMNVAKFLPVLVFFILAFAIAFKNLLQPHYTFENVGFAIVKTMVMAIGEIEFGDLFFNDAYINIHKVFAFIIFVIFLGIMTISMMNLLVGMAVGDIRELRQKSEQLSFRSKVNLILQYNCMFTSLSKNLHEQELQKFRKWRTTLSMGLRKSIENIRKQDLCWKIFLFVVTTLCCWLVVPVCLWCTFASSKYSEDLFTKYKDRLEGKYKKYKIGRDSLREKILDKENIDKSEILDKVMKEIDVMKVQINQQSAMIIKQSAQMTDQNDKILILNETIVRLNDMIKVQNANLMEFMNKQEKV